MNPGCGPGSSLGASKREGEKLDRGSQVWWKKVSTKSPVFSKGALFCEKAGEYNSGGIRNVPQMAHLLKYKSSNWIHLSASRAFFLLKVSLAITPMFIYTSVHFFILVPVFTKFDLLTEVVTNLNVVFWPAVIKQKEEAKHEKHSLASIWKSPQGNHFKRRWTIGSNHAWWWPFVRISAESVRPALPGSTGKALDESKQQQQDTVDTQLWLATKYHSHCFQIMFFCSIGTSHEWTSASQFVVMKYSFLQIFNAMLDWRHE